MTDIHDVIRKLEPGARVKLVEVDCTSFGGDVLRFHNYNVPHTDDELIAYQKSGGDIPPKTILWKGEQYHAWPYQLTGVELDGTGSSPSPILEVSNLDAYISSICLDLQNLFGAVVNEYTTFEQFLDGHEDADPEMFFIQTWYICRKAGENRRSVSFELASPADMTGMKLPRRQIHSMCHWALNGAYRGPDCGYTGTRYFTIKGEPTDNPALDQCGGLCNRDCKPRFGAENPIPFGGFIASSLIS